MSGRDGASPTDRADRHFRDALDANYRRTSRLFLALMIVQWIFAIVVALLWSPYAWVGKVRSIHVHVYAAVVLGGAISSLPIFLTLTRPAAAVTRMVVAAAQSLWSGLLVHLTGGRIETHFHVFVSLAFLAFYRDWKILVPATVVTASDHLMRGIFWPESVYGTMTAEWWRFLEHVFWVAFEDFVLVLACVRGVAETRELASRQAETEAMTAREREKSVALEAANEELSASRDALAQLAEVGELAASIGHDLRNPLGAVRNAATYVAKRGRDPELPKGALATDARFNACLGIMEKELETCSRIIADLLDFARWRKPDLHACPLGPLVDDAIALTPPRANVRLENEVPAELPVPMLDKDQFRQVLINLIQNGSEAIPGDRDGIVRVSASGGDDAPFLVSISDNGVGMADTRKIFQPLFTTKTKGTGLGLAIVAGMVTRHGGRIRVESETGKGSTFHIELPQAQADAAPAS